MTDLANAPAKDRADTSRPEVTHSAQFTPRVDIVESDEELTLFADLPGVPADGFDLRYEQGQLLLHGRVRPRLAGKRLLLNEYDEGDFYRAFTIHESIDSTRITAECKNGVLTVHLPKAEAVKPRQISVKAGA